MMKFGSMPTMSWPMAMPMVLFVLNFVVCFLSSHVSYSSGSEVTNYKGVKIEKRTVASSQCSEEKRSRKDDVISYHYCGRLLDGTEFDCSFNYGQPYVFKIGSGQVIPGMDVGMTGVCVGDALKITIASDLAYGSRGTKSIPGNSDLIFYVKVLQLDRDGKDIDQTAPLRSLMNSGLNAYDKKDWNVTIENLERVASLYGGEQAAKKTCTRQCMTTASVLSATWSSDLLHIGRCINKCLAAALGTTFTRSANAYRRNQLKQRKQYHFLQMAYHNVGEIAKGAAAAYTYHHHNINDSNSQYNVEYYTSHDSMKGKDISLLESIPDYVTLYRSAKTLYDDGAFQKAADGFEKTVSAFSEHLHDCWQQCYTDDISLSTPVSSGDFNYDIAIMYKEVAMCQLSCRERAENLGVYTYPEFHSALYGYLQFSYYNVEEIAKAASASATATHLNPTEEQSFGFYKNHSDVPPEALKPRLEAVTIKKTFEEISVLLDELQSALPNNPLGDDGEVTDLEALSQQSGTAVKAVPSDVNLFSKSSPPVGPPILSLVP